MIPAGSGRLVVVVLAVLTMIGPFTIDTVLPGFPAIGADLHADPAAVQQVLSVYLLTFAIASAFLGPLSDALGRRPVVVVGMLLYALTSLACAFAPSIGLLILARSAQGVVAGAGNIIARTMVRDLFEGVRAQQVMGQISMIFAVAPAVAPVFGGWLLGVGSWRWIFGFLALVGLALAAMALLLLPETHPEELRVPFRPGPLLHAMIDAARDGSVQRLSLAIGVNFAAFFVYICSTPQIVIDHLGMTAQDFGYVFIPLVVATVGAAWLIGRLSGRWSRDRLIALGFCVTFVGAVFGVIFHLVHAPSYPLSIVPMVCGAFGVGLVFPLLTLSLLDQLPLRRGSVASIQSVTSNTMNAAVAGILSPLVSHDLTVMALVSAGCCLGAAGLFLLDRRLRLRRSGPADPGPTRPGPSGSGPSAPFDPGPAMP